MSRGGQKTVAINAPREKPPSQNEKGGEYFFASGDGSQFAFTYSKVVDCEIENDLTEDDFAFTPTHFQHYSH